MSNEEDREALSELIDKKFDGDAGYGVGDWLAEIILEAGFRRTPAPASDVPAMIAEARGHLAVAADAAPRSARAAILAGDMEDQRMSLVARLADALEALVKERDELAAVIERAQHAGQVTGYSHHKEPVMQALDTAPANALREHDRVIAERAWDEGWAEALEQGIRPWEPVPTEAVSE